MSSKRTMKLDDFVAWLVRQAPGVFGEWEVSKVSAWVSHHAQDRRLIVVRGEDTGRVYGAILWQRIPDDLDLADAPTWGWQRNATAGARVYVSCIAGQLPISEFARLFQAAAMAPGVTSVVCHRRHRVRDLTHIIHRHGTLQT